MAGFMTSFQTSLSAHLVSYSISLSHSLFRAPNASEFAQHPSSALSVDILSYFIWNPDSLPWPVGPVWFHSCLSQKCISSRLSLTYLVTSAVTSLSWYGQSLFSSLRCHLLRDSFLWLPYLKLSLISNAALISVSFNPEMSSFFLFYYLPLCLSI